MSQILDNYSAVQTFDNYVEVLESRGWKCEMADDPLPQNVLYIFIFTKGDQRIELPIYVC